MRNVIPVIALLTAACAHGVPGPGERDPDVLELQVTVLDYVLEDSRDYLRAASIEQVCVVGAIKTRILGQSTWAGDRKRDGEWPAEVLAGRLNQEGWNVLPASDCTIERGRWISQSTGADVAIASAAGIDWATDETVFVEAGLARSASESFRFACTVDRTATGWAVRECESGRAD